uniref:Uncharacterized protein n=1 Tax=uncultured marine virus TaxID=186617 RepID=A0A0F7L2U5_9VIRU|nr:hypothetical protein [uncultured marine virus]
MDLIIIKTAFQSALLVANLTSELAAGLGCYQLSLKTFSLLQLPKILKLIINYLFLLVRLIASIKKWLMVRQSPTRGMALCTG